MPSGQSLGFVRKSLSFLQIYIYICNIYHNFAKNGWAICQMPLEHAPSLELRYPVNARSDARKGGLNGGLECLP
jgi:hypothetical protein